MSAMISFGDSEEALWSSWSLFYEALVLDVIAIAGDDHQVIAELEGSLGISFIGFDLLDKDMARRLFLLLKRVVVAVVNDEAMPELTWKETLDEKLHTEYRQSLGTLLELLNRHEQELLSEAK